MSTWQCKNEKGHCNKEFTLVGHSGLSDFWKLATTWFPFLNSKCWMLSAGVGELGACGQCNPWICIVLYGWELVDNTIVNIQLLLQGAPPLGAPGVSQSRVEWRCGGEGFSHNKDFCWIFSGLIFFFLLSGDHVDLIFETSPNISWTYTITRLHYGPCVIHVICPF